MMMDVLGKITKMLAEKAERKSVEFAAIHIVTGETTLEMETNKLGEAIDKTIEEMGDTTLIQKNVEIERFMFNVQKEVLRLKQAGIEKHIEGIKNLMGENMKPIENRREALSVLSGYLCCMLTIDSISPEQSYQLIDYGMDLYEENHPECRDKAE